MYSWVFNTWLACPGFLALGAEPYIIMLTLLIMIVMLLIIMLILLTNMLIVFTIKLLISIAITVFLRIPCI